MKQILLFFLLLLLFTTGISVYIAAPQTEVKNKAVRSSSQMKENKIKHVFVIVMENTNWSTIKDNRSAPYLNSLLNEKYVSYATEYYALYHPSEPNYIAMEAGDAKNLPNGEKTVDLITDGDPTEDNSTTTTEHLVTLIEKKNLSWKVYAEGISGNDCPIRSSRETHYTARHVPMLFFQDVTNTERKCIEHIRPFSELEKDLENNTVPHYSFIVPDLCNNMHDFLGCQSLNRITNGDDWLSETIPTIQSSPVFRDSVIFLTWDEGSGESTTPIGMIVISPFAKGKGYRNAVPYTQSSLLRTIQEIFSLQPFLREAENAQGLQDLFIR